MIKVIIVKIERSVIVIDEITIEIVIIVIIRILEEIINVDEVSLESLDIRITISI